MRLAVVHARKTICCSLAADTLLSSLPSSRLLPPCAGISLPWSAAHIHARTQLRQFRATTVTSNEQAASGAISPIPNHLEKLAKLPTYCPGCGAPSQIVSPEDAGHYTLTRQGLRKHLQQTSIPDLDPDEAPPLSQAESSIICDRCHNLLHHSEGVPVFHPSIQSIHDIIEESPHKHNHIYHILDAADLPMSLIPSLQADLRLPRLRTQNRRSKHINYTRGRSAEVSFIITRADLLAPKKEQVDSLLPYIRELLRDALGEERKNVRLGNLRCVSAKRGWWTTHVKEDIWKRGGAAWMVGKVNVGKSSLFEVVFPKGRGGHTGQSALNMSQAEAARAIEAGESHSSVRNQPSSNEVDDTLDEGSEMSLLPPLRQEVAYPAMPIASALPGTTASPIRVPFGSGKGELIDLPGVARSSLETYVRPAERETLVMRSRVAAEQHVIKPGQSLLLGGGLVRITPTTPDQIVLAYPFLPLEAHVTSTAKAMDIQAGISKPGVPTILSPDAHKALASAGSMPLRWDITRARAGPLTSKSDVKLKPSQLAFNVYGADVVIEGVGWVELVAQTRKQKAPTSRSPPRSNADEEEDPTNPFPETLTEQQRLEARRRQQQQSAPSAPDTTAFPVVEVFSPEGKYIALRRPMNAWLLGGRRTKTKTSGGSRPRRSMTSVKQNRKGREMAASSLGQ